MILTCQLLGRFGQKLEQIGKMHVSQKIDVLRRSEAGGYIWWYTLKYGQKTIASIDWCDYVDAFSLSVCLVVRLLSLASAATQCVSQEPDPEASPDILSKAALRQVSQSRLSRSLMILM